MAAPPMAMKCSPLTPEGGILCVLFLLVIYRLFLSSFLSPSFGGVGEAYFSNCSFNLLAFALSFNLFKYKSSNFSNVIFELPISCAFL
jgi:hypothetical protein